MTWLFDDDERATIAAALDEQVPGAAALGAVDYVQNLLDALDHDPPQIWAAPGAAAGGDPDTAWLELGPWEAHAWRQRIADVEALYRRVIDRSASTADRRALHAHACEATYGDPAYGGNRDAGGWRRIAFPEPIFPPTRVRRP